MPPRARISAKTMSSSAWVVTPGTTCGTSASRISAAQPAGGAHPGKAFGPVQLDRPMAADDAGAAVEEMGVHGGI